MIVKVKTYISTMLLFIFFTILLYSNNVNAETGKTYALLISGEVGEGANLSETDHDVSNMIDRINSNKLEMYPGQPIYTVTYFNPNTLPMSAAELEQYIKTAYKNATENDLAIFFYSGHGTPKDGKGVGLTISSKSYYPYKELAQLLSKNIKCKKIIIIMNACYSGGFYDLGISKLADRSRFIAFLSSQSWQESEGGYGTTRFGRIFVNGLGFSYNNVYADFNNDGKVTVDEMKTYLDIQLRADLIDDNINWSDQNSLYYAADNNFVIYQYKKASSSSLDINKKELELWEGESYTLSVTKHNISGTPTWTTSNTEIASVDKNGKITAKKSGTCIVTTELNGIKAICKVAVKKPTIKLNKSTLSITVGLSKTLTSTVTGKSQTVAWSSSDTKIAKVNSSGKITAIKAGTCTITAKANGIKATCKITVKKPTIKLDKTALTITVGLSKTLKSTVTGKSQTVTWSSSNVKIAKVNSSGKITAIKAGTCTITAKANGIKTTCKITVKKPTIKLDRTALTITAGLSKTLKSTVIGKSQTVTWSSSNVKIAKVDVNGKVTGVKAGTCTITAKANNVKTTCKVTIVPASPTSGNIVSVSVGINHSAAIKSDGSLWMWGGNGFSGNSDYFYYQLGINDSIRKLIPFKLMTNVSDVSLGSLYHSLALKTDNTLWLWGNDHSCNLGNKNHSSPYQFLDNVKSISAGYKNNAAITSNGDLWIWGDSTYGQTGNSRLGGYVVPWPVKLASDVTKVALGYESNNVAYITSNGDLWSCGADYGYKPQKIMSDVKDVSLGSGTYAAIKKDNSLWTWGSNFYGQLGDGTLNSRWYEPMKIMDNVKMVSMGHSHGAAIKNDGSLWMWGHNDYGQIGDGTKNNKPTPVKILNDVKYISMGRGHSAAIKKDGSLWMWGDNDYGQLGDGTTIDRLKPTKTKI